MLFFPVEAVGSKPIVFVDVKATASVNTAMTLSTLSTSSLEDVSEACSESACFLQLYVCHDHDVSRRLVLRAERAGCSAIFLTVDAPFFGKRRSQFYNPSCLSPHLQSAYLTFLTIVVCVVIYLFHN